MCCRLGGVLCFHAHVMSAVDACAVVVCSRCSCMFLCMFPSLFGVRPSAVRRCRDCEAVASVSRTVHAHMAGRKNEFGSHAFNMSHSLAMTFNSPCVCERRCLNAPLALLLLPNFSLCPHVHASISLPFILCVFGLRVSRTPPPTCFSCSAACCANSTAKAAASPSQGRTVIVASATGGRAFVIGCALAAAGAACMETAAAHMQNIVANDFASVYMLTHL